MSRFHTTTIPTDADYYIHKMGEVRSIQCVRALVIKSKSIRCIKDVQNWRVSGLGVNSCCSPLFHLSYLLRLSEAFGTLLRGITSSSP